MVDRSVLYGKPVRRNRNARILVPAICVFTVTSALSHAQEGLPTREAIVARFAAFENAVQASVAEFDVTCYPTEPNQLPRIEDVIAKNFSAPEPGIIRRYTYSPKAALMNSYSGKSWRRGANARIERFAFGSYAGAPALIMAVEGDTVRSLVRPAVFSMEPLRGSIMTVDAAHWNSGPQRDPANAVMFCYGRPWSQVLATANKFEVSASTYRGEPGYEVSFADPRVNTTRYTFRFDRTHRLRERDKFVKLGQDKHQRLYERDVFRRWSDVSASDNKVVSFPKEVRTHYAVGIAEDGEPAVYNEVRLKIRKLEINPELPDSLFTIEFPPGIEVVDESRPDFGQEGE